MGDALRILPRRPTPLPRAPSRRQRPFFRASKHLFFENPQQTLLRNSFGERFTLTNQKVCAGGYDLELRSLGRESGELTISISIRAEKKNNKVSISSITCKVSDKPDETYSKPSRENRGFGIVRLALQFARQTARELGITRITIQPYCRALEDHYLSFGFSKSPVTDTIRKHELVMHLEH